jgi:hypothetical protein
MTSEDRFAAAAMRLAELRAGFRARLELRLGELQERLVAARAGDAAAIADARSLAHSLAGTAGSYGFAEAGANVARIERALEWPPDEASWQRIDEALAAARASQ